MICINSSTHIKIWDQIFDTLDEDSTRNEKQAITFFYELLFKLAIKWIPFIAQLPLKSGIKYVIWQSKIRPRFLFLWSIQILFPPTPFFFMCGVTSRSRRSIFCPLQLLINLCLVSISRTLVPSSIYLTPLSRLYVVFHCPWRLQSILH